ncbi:solute carrier family 22 member 1-like [Ostrinia nubilalis]|uniref:solute carrier family 22 member 1-like n=1 Tax=Ostrinia nubilalis TaxID=29057 RepID=UPI00308261C4
MAKGKILKLHNPIEKHFNVITPYHYYFFFLIFLSKLPIFWHVLNLIFLTPPMKYSCEGGCPYCPYLSWDRSVFSETMQTKFNLVCDKTWLVSFSNSISYVGTLIGSLLFGFLSDKFGRLNSFTISCLILAISGCLVSVMPMEGLFIFMRCIEGIGVGGAIVTAYVLCIEFCGVRHRESVTALFHIPINISHMTLAGISYLLRHCDDFQLALSVPVFFFVAMKWLVMESPKWLMDNDRVEEAAIVMEKISKFNRLSSETIKEEIEAYHASQGQKRRTKVKFWQIFNHKKLTLNLGCMSVIYFVCGMGYYGVSQYIGRR